MLKVLLDEKWRDDIPVYEFFSGAEAKRYHTLLKSAFNRAVKSIREHEAQLSTFEKPRTIAGHERHRRIKTIKATINRNTAKRDAAKFRIDKIETAIKDWFAE